MSHCRPQKYSTLVKYSLRIGLREKSARDNDQEASPSFETNVAFLMHFGDSRNWSPVVLRNGLICMSKRPLCHIGNQLTFWGGSMQLKCQGIRFTLLVTFAKTSGLVCWNWRMCCQIGFVQSHVLECSVAKADVCQTTTRKWSCRCRLRRCRTTLLWQTSDAKAAGFPLWSLCAGIPEFNQLRNVLVWKGECHGRCAHHPV